MPRKIKWSFTQEPANLPINPIVPTKTVVPDWYRKFPSKTPDYVENVLPENVTVKKCMPILDAFTSGYVITTTIGLGVTYDEVVGPKVTWSTEALTPITVRKPGLIPSQFVPTGFSPVEFVWKIEETIELPAGYSMLWTHPLNRHDLPFYTLSGIVDGGWSMYGGNIPFFIKEGYEGIIPIGTPIAQLIPLKHESWVLERDPKQTAKGEIQRQVKRRALVGWYKNTWWNKKSYN